MSDTLQAVKNAIAVVLMDEYAVDDPDAIQNLAEAALRAASLHAANIYTVYELDRVLMDLGKASLAAGGHEGHLQNIRATEDARELARHVTKTLNMAALVIGTLRHSMTNVQPDVTLLNMAVLVAEMLPPEQRDALTTFTTVTELLQAENPHDLRVLDDLMRLGLVSKTLAGGYVFMQLRPLGVEVWKALNVPGMTKALENTDAR